jgi:hypothetical protein
MIRTMSQVDWFAWHSPYEDPASHPRAGDVVARLVELGPRSTALARHGASPFTGSRSGRPLMAVGADRLTEEALPFQAGSSELLR